MTNETKIDPQYGFVNCDASDPARTELWCPLWKMWCKPQDVDLVAAVKDHNCGQNWRKEILLPDGKPNGQSDEWELVGMDESFLGDTNPTVFLEGAWHSDWLQTDQQGEICCKTPREHSKTHPESIIIAFARRKTKPAPVEAKGSEPITVREACRKRRPLDGADAQALEHALTQCAANAELATWKELTQIRIEQVVALDNRLAESKAREAELRKQLESMTEMRDRNIVQSEVLENDLRRRIQALESTPHWPAPIRTSERKPKREDGNAQGFVLYTNAGCDAWGHAKWNEISGHTYWLPQPPIPPAPPQEPSEAEHAWQEYIAAPPNIVGGEIKVLRHDAFIAGFNAALAGKGGSK